MPIKNVHLEVYNGLCNRLRAIVSGICMAEDLNCKLVIYWPSDDPGCAIAFSEIFEVSGLPNGVEVVEGYSPGRSLICNSYKDAYKAASSCLTIKSMAAFYIPHYIRWRRHLQRIQIIYAIRKQVIRNANRLPLNMVPVGVHLRRSDNIMAIKKSPLAAFECAMTQIKNGYFFIMSDDRDAVAQLAGKFPSKVYSHEVIRNRNTIEGMKEAVVSLYTLSLCKSILGSYHSSFSRLAANIGNSNLLIIDSTRKKYQFEITC